MAWDSKQFWSQVLGGKCPNARLCWLLLLNPTQPRNVSPSGPHFTDEEAEKEREATCLAHIVQADLDWSRGLALSL